MGKKESNELCLAEDVKYLIVETDEENPIRILKIDRSDEPIKVTEGYRVRLGFADD